MFDKILESIIDYPSEMNPDIWIQSGDSYTITPEAKDFIYEMLQLYPDADLLDIANDIHITGSIGTNQWVEDTDIDVHLIPDKDKITGDAQEFQKAVFRWYKNNRDDINGYFEGHPIEVYIQLLEAQEYLSDALYSVTDDKWLKGPLEEPYDFDPYEEFSHILDDVKGESEKADIELGELKRDLIDYETIKKAITKLPEENRQNLINIFKSKLGELEKDLDDLLKLRKEWVDARKDASAPVSIEQALGDLEMAKSWRDRNAIFKLLNRYDYIRLIGEMEEFMEDKELTDNEVDIIQGMVK